MRTRARPALGGREQFERIVGGARGVEPAGDAHVDAAMLERGLHALARAARRGAIVVVLSDLHRPAAGGSRARRGHRAEGRVLVVVQTLDPDEVDFPFAGNVRLRALEGGAVVETDADTARERYLAAMEELTPEWREVVVRRGGRFLASRAPTTRSAR